MNQRRQSGLKSGAVVDLGEKKKIFPGKFPNDNFSHL